MAMAPLLIKAPPHIYEIGRVESIPLLTAALMRCVNGDRAGGLYHLAAAGQTTWYSYARHVIATARDAGWPVCVSDDAIEPVTAEAFPAPARRPYNSRLDTTRLESTFGLRMPDWRAGVDRALDEILALSHHHLMMAPFLFLIL